jgi:Haem-binding domain
MVNRQSVKRWAIRILAAGAALFIVLQLVPYGWWHVNPPVTADAPWPDAASAQLAHRACYDCHSNETSWPLYSYIAPFSWLVRRDVQSGRKELNFSKWDQYADKADDAVDQLTSRAMPPGRYTLLHPDAELSRDEIAQLAAALTTMDEGRRGNDSGPDDSGRGSDDPGRGGG